MSDKFKELREKKYEYKMDKKLRRPHDLDTQSPVLYPYCINCSTMYLSFSCCPIICDHCNAFLLYIPLPVSHKECLYERVYTPPEYKGKNRAITLLRDVQIPKGEESWVDDSREKEENEIDDDEVPF